MRYATGLLAVLTISTIALADDGKFAKPPTPKPAPTSTSLSARATFGDPIQVESLTLTPILANAPGADEKLLVLDEAMPKKLVRIHEVDGGDVNNLRLTNRSDQPLFLLAGEVIIGGKQDRIIGSNTIVPPKKTQDVPVFCVEHGRWDNSSKEFTTANALAHGRLRGRANFDTQSDVWQEVAAKNEQRNTKSKSDTYRHVAAQQANGTLANWEKQVNTALAKLPAASKGKLVRSYITEAIDVKHDKTAKTPTGTDVEAFIADAEKAAEQRSFETDVAASSVQKGEKAARARVMYKKPAAADANASAPTVAAPPKAVYESYQAR